MAAESDLAKSSLLAAALNSLVAIILRLLTFVSNAFILRYVSREALGIINVRLLLFSDTVLFVSREAFRKACLGRCASGDWTGTINLIWLSCPLSILSSLALGYLWKYGLEMPSSQDETDQYRTAIDLMSVGAVLEIFCEPFFMVGQINKFVKFRSVVDFIHLAVRTFLMVAVVVVYPNMSILLFGCAHLVATALLLFINICFFGYVIRTSKSKNEENSFSSFQSLKQFLPNFSGTIDQDQFQLARAFFKQGIVKQLLTEGEKYMFTCFSLMTLTQQGIYDVVGNLGSLAARLVFSKIEESAYFYFTQTVSREKDAKNLDKEVAALKHLTQLLRWMTLLGLIICAFGFSFSHLLLFIYGGHTLSEGLGTLLLRGHCVFVLFMAINGVSECFSFAVMSRSEVDAYNYVLGLLSVAFLFLAWACSKVFGPIGFIVANCSNFAFRICHNFYVIEKRQRELGVDLPNPVLGMIPSMKTLAVIFGSGVICQISEVYLYQPGSLQTVIPHVALGAGCFLATCLVTILDEPLLMKFVAKLVKKMKEE